jgi:RNA polymerase sigma factor (sigma-70 family)
VAEADESPEDLFLAQMETIERAIRQVCRRGSLRDEDAEDFASYVMLKLIEKDYCVIRKYERRSSFAGYIFVVVQRFLLDYRNAQWGKWHASAEATRLGEVAVTIEAMLHRDGRTLDEVFPVLVRRWPALTRGSVETIVQRLPARQRRMRAVDWESAGARLENVAAKDDPYGEKERQDTAARIATTIRAAVGELDNRDRLIFRLCFEGKLSIADISRTLHIEQKPLYRRLKRTLAMMRSRLESAGVSAADAEEVLSSRDTELDFGFTDELPSSDRSSSDEEGP